MSNEEILSGLQPATPTHVETLVPELKAMLEEHQCSIVGTEDDGYTITYPPGTTKQEILLRTMEARFKLVLPDGFEVREIDTRSGKTAVFAVLNTLPAPG